MQTNDASNQEMPKQIICMKWGTLYGAEYVNRLYAMVRANITGDIRFVCLTDNSEGIRAEIECHECPTIPIGGKRKNAGWRKLTLYRESEHLFGISGDWLYLDLDVVVTGSLEPFFEYKPEKAFIVMQNWTQPGQGIGNTSVFRYRIGEHVHIYDDFVPNYKELFKVHSNSQTYVSRTVKDLTFWPDSWCTLFKVQCVPPWPIRFFKAPIIPEGCLVVAFPGDPNPHDAAKGHWPVKKFWKRFYKFIRPSSWIEENWGNAERAVNQLPRMER